MGKTTNDRLDKALAEFKAILAEESSRRGRDYIRGLPQGLLLDALNAGRPDTSHDQLANARGTGFARSVECLFITAVIIGMFVAPFVLSAFFADTGLAALFAWAESFEVGDVD